MANKYKILTPRGFYRNGAFTKNQLEDSFLERVFPVLIFPSKKLDKELIKNLAIYLQRKYDEFGYFPILSDIALETVGAGDNILSWDSDCKNALYSISELNNYLKEKLKVTHVTIKLPSILPYDEELKKRWSPSRNELLNCPIDIDEYKEWTEFLKTDLDNLATYANNLGIIFTVENDQPTYFVGRGSVLIENPKDFFKKHKLLDLEPRHGKVLFPWHIQCCSLNSNPETANYILKNISEKGFGGLMYDPEHWQMTYNYAFFNPIESTNLSEKENDFILKYGYLVKKGEKILYKEALTPVEALRRLEIPVFGLHISGFPNQPIYFYDRLDNGDIVIKIAETFPLIFDTETMKKVVEFYEDRYKTKTSFADLSYAINDKKTYERLTNQIYKNMGSVIREARKRPELDFLVIEMKIGAGKYSGEEWRKFLRTSKASLEYLLEQ